MITELRVRDLGVIEDIEVLLNPGLTVITGETGAGKTLVVEALELLLGARADSSVVRHGATECVVEGRFATELSDVVLQRVVPANGRSRAYLDMKMAPVGALEEIGRDLVDLYGQHEHQSLLRPATQRRALDEFCGVDLEPVVALRRERASIDERLTSLGGDDRARGREIDLLRFECDEIDAAAIVSADELDEIEKEEEQLAYATALRGAAEAAYEAMAGGIAEGAIDRLGAAIEHLGHAEALRTHAERLLGLVAEADDAASELRRAAEGFEEDPVRLAFVQERRQLLARLVRKHGESLADVLKARATAAERLLELESTDELRSALHEQRSALLDCLADAEQIVGDQRRAGAERFAAAVAEHFGELALGGARLSVSIGADGLGDDVEFLFGANPGEPELALTRVASGGELARVMLALRLVLSAAPPTLVFDEVDAGIGGEAAVAVGRALAELGRTHQVLVVTHLAQVAAHADHQLVVEKVESAGRTYSLLRPVTGEERVVELSRMLSGQPGSSSARLHAAELLELAGSSAQASDGAEVVRLPGS